MIMDEEVKAHPVFRTKLPSTVRKNIAGYATVSGGRMLSSGELPENRHRREAITSDGEKQEIGYI